MAKPPQKKTPADGKDLTSDTPVTYVSRITGWVAGLRVKAGNKIDLTPKAAKYEPVDLAKDDSSK